VVLAGGLAGSFAIIGNFQGRRNEHRVWRRDARRQAYLTFISSVEACSGIWIEGQTELREPNATDLHEALIAVERAARDLMLLGPDGVLDRVRKMYSMTTELAFSEADRGQELRSAIATEIIFLAADVRRALRTHT
jgi:hypothetical protein